MPSNKKNKKKNHWLRWLFRIVASVIAFLLLIVLFVRSSWGQGIIVDKIVKYVSEKTNTKVEIDKAFVTFDGNIKVQGLFLEDTKKDTLVYLNSLEADLPLIGMIKGTTLGVENIEIEGLKANIERKDTINGYNFQFLIDAFVTETPGNSEQEATTKSPIIVIGDFSLKNINFTYNDAPLGIQNSNKIGSFKGSFDTIDLEKMVFKANEIWLVNSDIIYQQLPALIVSTEEVVLPKLYANSITVNRTKLQYDAIPQDFYTDVDINTFTSNAIALDLQKSVFAVETVFLKDTKAKIEIATNQKENQNNSQKNQLLWPELSVNIDNITFENNTVAYILNKAEIKENVFNPNAIVLDSLNLEISKINYVENEGNLFLKSLTFHESSGFNLQRFTVETSFSDNNIAIDNFLFASNKNTVAGNANLNFKSIEALINRPENVTVDLQLPTIQLNINEISQFVPNLKANPYISELGKKMINGQLHANGTLSKIDITESTISWGKSTEISVEGSIYNATTPDFLKVDIPNFKISTARNDILNFVDQKALGIQLPKEIFLEGKVNGTIENVTTEAKLISSQGIIALKGGVNTTQGVRFDADLEIKEYKIDQLLQDDSFGTLSLQINTEGKGESINSLNGKIDATVSKFTLNDYAIEDLSLKGNFVDGIGNLSSKYKDENINANLKAFVDLDSINTLANLTLDLVGVDLQGIGVMQRNIKAGMDISVDFEGNLEKYQIKALVDDGAVVYDNKTYLVGQIDARGFIDKDTTSVTLKNKMIDLKLASNTDPQSFGVALQKHISSYFYRDVIIADSIQKPVNITLESKIVQTPLISDVFLVNVKDIDTVSINVDFDELKRKLNANITAPHINYNDSEVDSLAFTMNTDKENFNFKLGFKDIKANPLFVPKTVITGNQKNNELSLNFAGYYDSETLMNVNAKITGSKERLRFTVNPNKLILNKHIWSIPADNEVVLENSNTLLFNNFKITKGNQSIRITDKLEAITNNHVALEYNNFKISEVFNYLNPEKEIVKGVLNGNFVLEQPFGDTGILANLNINKLELLKTNFGKLTIDAKSKGYSTYDFNAKLKEGDIDLDLTGDYIVANQDAKLNLNLNINKFSMSALNTLSLGEIKEANGSFTGNFKVDGKTSNPQYNGGVQFNDAVFKITKLNTKFTLVNEDLKVDNQGLYVSNFTVLDAKRNKLVLTGDIKTESFLNPSFNLELKADNFRVLNASKEDNEDLYGIATFNANAQLTGDLQIPKLTADVTLGSDTKVTYVLPSTYANIEKRDNVVVFVNRKNPNAILTQREEQTAIVSGFDIATKLSVSKEASVTVVIDKNTGDNFKVSGDGDFIFDMSPNGRIGLSGTFEVAEGHYELNLYGLVNRKFNLAPGGLIKWSGNPFNADINVSAIYNVETSAAPLMAAQISDEDPSVKNRFRQVIPFNVYLNIDGELLQPKISFNLSLPEEERGAIGGQVYGRVQQVNQQEEELNKQVFSLLVLNRFYPNSGSDGSAGGFATIARDNLNDAVSEQLNAFSNKILGNAGIEINFDLNSYTDYQSTTATDRTDLGVTAQKKLFSDRLVVRVGSDVNLQGSNSTQQASPLIGNVSLEYKITEDGRYRLKGFRKSEFENVIDGQTIISGVALIFMQEFNEFRELWNAIFSSQNKEKETEEEQNNKTN